ncbi:MAG TPA: hypothetical protein VEI25_17175 [Paraburkholderia sp.]|nr:hypothetical protein [Paraburkholderia sp.]
MRDDGQRGVFWKSPESWQAPQGIVNDSRAVDPFAEMTRQLTGPDDDAPVRAEAQVGAPGADTPCLDRPPTRLQGDSARCPLSLGLSARSAPFADRRGYAIYVLAQPASQGMYRACAEITKDGRRVERSGLVGPRFEHPEAAEQYALEWAQKWIARQALALADVAQGDAVVETESRGAPVSRSMPAPRPAAASTTPPASHPASSPVFAAGTAARKPAVASPSSAPAPVSQHVNVSADRARLRRYPVDNAADTSTDRCPTLPELISQH